MSEQDEDLSARTAAGRNETLPLARTGDGTGEDAGWPGRPGVALRAALSLVIAAAAVASGWGMNRVPMQCYHAAVVRAMAGVPGQDA
jgi:hypothetical protein